jgi:basic region leucine zipper protein
MSPTNLQGLNLISPTQPSESFPADSHDSQDLLNLSYLPELSAQLDIWTNLAFESDEPLVHLNDKKTGGGEANRSTHSVEDDEEDDPDDGQPAQADNHDNVVMADPVSPRPTQPRTASRPLTAFDIGSLLAGFVGDPFVAPPVQNTATAPSLAQILSLYPNAAYPPPPASVSEENNTHPTPTKRARVRRPSASLGTSDQAADSSAPSPGPLNNSPLAAAEDKRRRNTAASARFRLKKKEREAALEKKSKELEHRVTELERECEGLRRENGWLKGLVVGVTGVGTTQQTSSAGAGVKRPRDAVDGVGK